MAERTAPRLGSLGYPLRYNERQIVEREFPAVQIELPADFRFFFLKSVEIGRDFRAAGNVATDGSEKVANMGDKLGNAQ
jgi:hypothetical protein